MKKLFLIQLSVVVFITLFSCKHTKKAANAVITKEDNVLQVQAANSVPYRLIVSFFSKGEGVNHHAKSLLEEFLQKQTIKYDRTRWGREGEVDFCFFLNEMDADKQAFFVRDIKALLLDQQGVNLFENSLSIHKR
jgi:hypothetical protein